MDKEELYKIVQQLIKLGEDQDELNYWLEIYDDLPEEKQILLCGNLTNELETLQKKSSVK